MESTQRYASVAEYNAKNFNKRHVFILNHRNEVPSVVQLAHGKATGLANYFPVSVSLPMEDEIFDEAEGLMRVIRFIPGEMTIYKDKQREDPANPKRPERMQFLKGELVVDGRETQKLEFLEKSDWNGANPKRNPNKPIKFFALDLASSMKTEMDKDKLKMKAIMWCHEAPVEEILAHARVMSLDLDRDIHEIRWGLKIMAERDYEQFLKIIDNPVVKRKHTVLEAIERGVLKVDTKQNAISWVNGGIIQVSPIGKDPVNHLVDSTFGSPDGETVFAVIQSQLAVKPSVQKTPVFAPKAPVVDGNKVENPSALVNINPEAVIADAVTKNIIAKNGPAWFIYNGDKIQKKALVEQILTNEGFRNELLSRISDQ